MCLREIKRTTERLNSNLLRPQQKPLAVTAQEPSLQSAPWPFLVLPLYSQHFTLDNFLFVAFAEHLPAESTGLTQKQHQWAGAAGRCTEESLPTWLVLLPFLLLVLTGEQWQSQPVGWRFPLLCFCLLPFAVILNSARQ